jgi:hypothetical protein
LNHFILKMSNTGVVRGTIGYASAAFKNFYSQAENYTLMQYAKPWVPVVAPVVTRVAAAADPWVDSLDVVVTETWKTVNQRVVEPARKKNPSGAVTIFGVAAEVQQVAAVELKNRYTALLDLSDHAVDMLLPEVDASTEAETAAETTEVKTIVSKAQRRVFKRLNKQWADAKQFSSGRLKEMVHVDLIQYAEQGYSQSVVFVEERVIPVVKQTVNDIQVVSSVYRAQLVDKLKLALEKLAFYRELAQSKATQLYNEYYPLFVAQYQSFVPQVLALKSSAVEKYSKLVQEYYPTLQTYYQAFFLQFVTLKTVALDALKQAQEFTSNPNWYVDASKLAQAKYTEASTYAQKTYSQTSQYAQGKYSQASNYLKETAVSLGVPTLVGKAKEVSLGEVSEYVLIKLNFSERNDRFEVVEKKILDLFRTLAAIIVKQTTIVKVHTD